MTVGGSSEVILGHEQSFANSMQSRIDTDVIVIMVSKLLSYQDASTHMQHDLLESLRDLELRSNFQVIM